MMEHRFDIKNLLFNHNIHKRYIAFLTALSLLMTLGGSFIMPETIKAADDQEYFSSAPNTPPDGAYELTGDDITGVNVTNTGNAEAVYDEETNTWTITSDDDTIGATFTLQYKIDPSKISVDQPYLYYWIPEEIEILGNYEGNEWMIYDFEHYDGVAAYFAINENGLLVIRFTEEYIREVISNATEDGVGTVEFYGEIFRADTAKGDKEADLGDTTIYFEFESHDFTVTKSGNAEDTASSDGKVVIDWTITVTNDYTDDPENTLEGLRLEDERFKNAVGEIEVDPDGYGYWATDDDGNKYYQFYDHYNGDEPESVTFKFKEKVDYEDIDMDPVTNTATLYDEDEIISTGTANVNIDSSTITKKGNPQYTAGNDDDTITWEVYVERPYGLSLDGYYVQDDAFLNEGDISIEVLEPDDGTVSFELDKNDGTIKFSGNASKVKITYTTNALGSNDGVDRKLNENNEGSITNNSKFLTPEKDEIDKDTGYVYYEKQYHIDYKTGSYDRIESEIIWNIRAHANDGTTLDGYELTDPAFVGLTSLSSITVTIDGQSYTISNAAFPITIGPDGSKATITKDESGKLTIHGAVQSIDITYETDVTDTQKQYAPDVSNEVSDNHGNSQGDTVDVGNRDRQTTKKSLGADEIDAEKSGVWYIDPKNPGQMQRTLSWQVDMISDTGFTDYSLTDNLTTPAEPAGITHYIDTESVKVLAYLDNTAEYLSKPAELKEGTDYTIKWTPNETNPTGFEINFIGDNVNKYHYIQVIYDSIVTLPASTAAEWEYDDNAQHRFTFKNTANDADADHTFVVQDKTQIAKTKLTVKKTWKDKSSKNRPSSITYYLERKLGENGEWERIYWNSTTGEWEVDTAGTHTYKLSSSSGWTKEWTELPWDTQEHEDVYYYRAVEVSEIDGYTTSYEENIFETGVNGNQTFTIVNSQDMGMKKSIIGIDGSSIGNGSTIDINNLATLNIDGTDYYIINYGIELDNSGGTNYVITDYLPQVPDGYEGFTLVHVPYYGTNDDSTGIVSGYYLPHHPLVYQNALSIGMWLYGYGNEWITFDPENIPDSFKSNNYYYDEANHIAYFGPSSEATRIEYEIKIPVSELNELLANSEEGFEIKNNASTSTGATSSVKVTVTGVAKSDPPEEKGAVIKEVNGDVSSNENDGGRLMANQGRITYSIYVNPEGKTLSNTGEYDVIDDLYFEALTLAGYDGNALKELLEAGLVSVTVEEITDFSYDDDGNIVVAASTPLPEDEYSYVFDDSPITVDTTTVTYAFNSNGVMTSGLAMGGDEVTLKISTGVPNFKFESDNEYTTYSIICDGQAIYDLTGATCDENGDLEITFIIPEGVTNGSLSINNYSSLPDNTGVRATAIRTSTIEASGARLTVTVPDEKPLKITYTYNITYNNSNLTTDSNLTISNNASINTGNVTASDSADDVDFVVKGGGGTITFDEHIKFIKSDVGDSTIKLQGAQFYIAQWDGTGTWTFASDITKKAGDSFYTVSFEDGVTTTDRTVPATGAAVLEITDEDYENGANKLNLESGYLYKFIEIKVPDGGYEAADEEVAAINPGDGIDSLKDLLTAKLKDFLNNPNSFKSDPYYNLLNKFVAVHYIQIGDRDEGYSIPGAITEAQITTIQSGGTIDIPDNRRINITAQKAWNFTEDEAALEGKVSAQLELYWSYTKSSSGIPSDAKKATAENLGLTELENPKTVTGNDMVTWEGLPNGNGDRPIYYYVKEVSYTITSGNSKKTYKLQSDGTYQTDDGETGDFFPSYTGNAVNKSNSSGPIKVTNSSHLVVYKVWKDYNGNTITDESKLPAQEIRFELWGKKMTNGREEQILNPDDPENGYFTISAPDWKFEIPEEYLTGYTSFSVKEVDTFDGYSVSYSYTVNDKTGEITITNKSTIPDEIDVSVKKVWVGSDSKPNKITVKLYQTTEKQSDNGLSLAESGAESYKTQDLYAPDWTYKWEGLPAREDGTNKKYYYYVIEESIDGYMAAYSRTDGTASQSVTIKNTPSGDLFVDKIWLDAEGNALKRHPDSIDVEIYYTLRPAAATQSFAPIKISLASLAEQTRSSSPFEGISTLSAISNTSPKVFALGDSITYGTESTNEATDSYPAQLENKLMQSGYVGASVARCGHPNYKIEGIHGELDKDWGNGSYDFTTLIAGTNDLVNSGDPIDDAADQEHSIKPRMQALVEDVFQKGDSNHVVFVGAVPAIVYPAMNYQREGEYYAWTDDMISDLNKKWDGLVKEYNAMLYEMVCEYQEDETCEFSDRIFYVDTYTDKVQTTQGVHPTDKGYEDIATAFNSAIVSYLSGTIDNDNQPDADDDGVSGDGTDNDTRTADKESGLPDDFYDSGNNVNTGTYKQYTVGSQNGRYTLDFSDIEPDADGRYHFDLDWLPKYDGNGNEYVYYVKEVLMDGYTTTYENNDGHTLDGSTITITNQKEPSSGIEIEKLWYEKDGTEASGNAEPSDRDSITVKLTQKKIPKEQTGDTGSSGGGDDTSATPTPEPGTTVTPEPGTTVTPEPGTETTPPPTSTEKSFRVDITETSAWPTDDSVYTSINNYNDITGIEIILASDGYYDFTVFRDSTIVVESRQYNAWSGTSPEQNEYGEYVVKLSSVPDDMSRICVTNWGTNQVIGVRFYRNTTATAASLTNSTPLMSAAALTSPAALTSAVATISASDVETVDVFGEGITTDWTEVIENWISLDASKTLIDIDIILTGNSSYSFEVYRDNNNWANPVGSGHDYTGGTATAGQYKGSEATWDGTEYLVDIGLTSSDIADIKSSIAVVDWNQNVKGVRFYYEAPYEPLTASCKKETIIVGETAQITTNKSPVSYEVISGGGYVSVDENGVITGISEGTATIEVTYTKDDNTTDTQYVTITVEPAEVVREITISRGSSKNGVWDTISDEDRDFLENLPVEDENYSYLYFIDEIESPDGYSTKYFIDGEELTDFGAGFTIKKGTVVTVTVVNTKTTDTEPDNPEITLPDAGGNGAFPYAAAGAALAVMALAALTQKKRRSYGSDM